MTKLLYFAWLRERAGINEEEVEIPADIKTVSGLLDWIASRGENFEAMMEDREIIRVAVNKKHITNPEASIEGAREIAFFPPMTGG